MDVQLGGHCSNTGYFTVKLHICKPVDFSATFGTVVTRTRSPVFEDISADRKQSGGKEGNKEEEGMEG